MKPRTLLLAGFTLIMVACNGNKDMKYQSVEPADFAKKMDSVPEAQILDVRTPEEYASEHIDKAKNLNWNSADFEAQAAALDKDKPVFVYCQRGNRSKKASDKLTEMGFKKVYELDGGFVEWSKEGLNDTNQTKK